jgi:hypothetical protein
MTFDRNFVNGDAKISGLTQPCKIYGKPSSISENLTEVANQLKSEIDTGDETIIKALIDDNSVTNLAANRVKTNYKNLIDTKINDAFNNVNSDAQDFANKQAEYIQNIEKLNSVVGGQLDGKTLVNGVPKGYLISIDTDFNDAYSLVCSGITNFYNLLSANQFLPSGSGSPYFEFFTSLNTVPFGGIVSDTNNLLFTLFYDDLKDSTKREQFIKALTTNLIPSSSAETISSVNMTVNTIIMPTLNSWNSAVVQTFTEFKKEPETQQYLNYNPQINNSSIKGIPRVYNFTTSGVTDTQLTSLKSLFSSVNSNNDNQTFNGKKQFN